MSGSRAGHLSHSGTEARAGPVCQLGLLCGPLRPSLLGFHALVSVLSERGSPFRFPETFLADWPTFSPCGWEGTLPDHLAPEGRDLNRPPTAREVEGGIGWVETAVYLDSSMK